MCEDLTDLAHLIRFGLIAYRLEIQDLFDTVFREDVVAAANALVKAEMS